MMVRRYYSGSTIARRAVDGRWRWQCTYTCDPRQNGPWVDTRDEAEDGWVAHCTLHMPSNAKIMRAMGVVPGFGPRK
jgi:hypothetical protein